MARPVRNNALYFSHDADMRNDTKIKALRRKYKLQGYAVWCMLLEYLTDCDFFEFEYNDLNIELLSGDFCVDPEYLRNIIDYCVSISLLSHEDGKIFSYRHRERFESLLSKRKRERKGVIADDNSQNKVNNNIVYYSKEKEKEKVIENDNEKTNVHSEKNLPSISQTKETISNGGDVSNLFEYDTPDRLNKAYLMTKERLSNEVWIFGLSTQFKLTQAEILKLINTFSKEIVLKYDHTKSDKKLREHFVNYLKKQLNGAKT